MEHAYLTFFFGGLAPFFKRIAFGCLILVLPQLCFLTLKHSSDLQIACPSDSLTQTCPEEITAKIESSPEVQTLSSDVKSWLSICEVAISVCFITTVVAICVLNRASLAIQEKQDKEEVDVQQILEGAMMAAEDKKPREACQNVMTEQAFLNDKEDEGVDSAEGAKSKEEPTVKQSKQQKLEQMLKDTQKEKSAVSKMSIVIAL